MLISQHGFSNISDVANYTTANVSAQVDLLIQNASCIFFSLTVPDAAPEDLEKYSVALYSQSQIASATFNLDTTQAYNISSCNATTCNGSTGAWQTQFGLFPSQSYWIVSSYSWAVSNATGRTMWIGAQAFPAGG